MTEEAFTIPEPQKIKKGLERRAAPQPMDEEFV
jgi:hypothetical protein